MSIEKIMPQSNHTLQVCMSDGRAGVFDVRPYLDYEVFAPPRQSMIS